MLAVLDQAQWTCWICWGPIDPALRWLTHPKNINLGPRPRLTREEMRAATAAHHVRVANNAWVPSLDHIVAICRGGPHIVSNVRAAHHECNAFRNDGPNWWGPPDAPGSRRAPQRDQRRPDGELAHYSWHECICPWCLLHPYLPQAWPTESDGKSDVPPEPIVATSAEFLASAVLRSRVPLPVWHLIPPGKPLHLHPTDGARSVCGRTVSWGTRLWAETDSTRRCKRCEARWQDVLRYAAMHEELARR